MLNMSIDLIKGFSADICIYNLRPSFCSDCGQFVTGLLTNVAHALHLYVRDGARGDAGSSFVPSGFWELQKSKYLDVIPSPKGFTGIRASVPMQHRCIFRALVAKAGEDPSLCEPRARGSVPRQSCS